MTRDLQRIYVILPGGRVRQGALFGRAQRLKQRVCKVYIQGFRRPMWLPEVDVYANEVDAQAASRSARGQS